jgi:GT2 family glycosyltransferase
MIPNRKPRALLLQLEFSNWARARSWSYSANFGIQEGLEANGFECVTVPIIADWPDGIRIKWFAQIRRLLADQQFDHVWIWLVHSHYDREFLEWMASLAPVRIGFLMESLTYGSDVYATAPHLRGRDGVVRAQLPYLTHVLACDEWDEGDVIAAGDAKALWWPSALAKRWVTDAILPPINPTAAFYGAIYGDRQAWLDRSDLSGLLTRPPAPENETEWPSLFDNLQHALLDRVARAAVDLDNLGVYVRSLRRVRENIFTQWLQSLSRWSVSVNLPSFAKFYPGRVVESMGAGCPVISWDVPDRPRNAQLFTPGRDFLVYQASEPSMLARHISRVVTDKPFRLQLAVSAREQLLRYHTVEQRIGQVLSWIETGTQPIYGERGESSQLIAAGTEPPHYGEVLVRPSRTTSSAHQNDDFYVNLFVKSSYWSTPHPNPDEAARWSKIASFLEHILRRVNRSSSPYPLRMVEIGSGRGWLTNLASSYGECEGIEPVLGVVEQARKFFPYLRFEAGTAETVFARADFKPYDVVLCSEVIEHVPHTEKANFIRGLRQLLKPGGYVILTTPRGDVWDQWSAIAPPNQPVEDWLTEAQLAEFLEGEGFQLAGLERVYVEVPNLRFFPAPTPTELRSKNLLPIYQILAARLPMLESARMVHLNCSPRVSVIVPTYNRPERLAEALASINAQTFQDFEIIVIDDGEMDVETVVQAHNAAGRVTYIKHDRNRGLAAARNTGIRAAKGKYVAYLDDDDRYLPDHLETLVSFLEHHESKVAYTDAWRVHERIENGRHIETGRDLLYSNDFNSARLLVSNYFPVLCVMHERMCIDEVGTFDESLFAHEDWDLWIRMASRFPFSHLKRTTCEFTWRTDGSSMTSATRETYWRTMDIIHRKYRPYAERISGVLEAQQQELENLRASIRPQTFDCSVIIPVWNKRELTEQCLTELARVTVGVSYEVIVVDNRSTDDTASFLSQLSGDIQIIRNSENLGFAKACNQGALAARGRFLVFLNNDTIPLNNWLSALVSEATSHSDVGIVGSKLLYEADTVQHAGVVFSRDGLMPYHLYRGFHRDHPAVNQRRTFQSVTAACMLIRKDIFEAAGGFDEGFQNGFEDVDLCLKVRDNGWKIVYQPLSVLYHLESQTPGRKIHDQANALRFLRRWGQRWWLADEDVYYYEDGFVCAHTKDEGKELLGLRPLVLDGEKASWRLVVEAERAALHHDIPLLESLLARWNEWPSVADVLRWGAWLCTKISQLPLSRHFYEKLLRDHDDPAASMALARMALEEGNLSEAAAHLGVLLKRFPQDGEGWVLRGILNMQQAQYVEAEQAFMTALTNHGDRRKSMMGLGMARVGQEESALAWNDFCTVLDEYPDDAEAIHWLLRTGTVRGMWGELSERLQGFLSRNPAELSIRYALSGVLLRSGQTGAAQQEYRALCTLAPSYEGLEELAQALSMQDTLVEIVPQT